MLFVSPCAVQQVFGVEICFVVPGIYLSNCVVYDNFLWFGRESSWLTCLPHYPTRYHTHMSLLINASPFLHCLGYTLRILGRPRHPINGPTPLYFPNNRGSSETSTVYPIHHHDLAVFANPCQLLLIVYETHAPHYPRCTCYIHRISFLAVHLQPQAST